jgi:hypothetical protein
MVEGLDAKSDSPSCINSFKTGHIIELDITRLLHNNLKGRRHYESFIPLSFSYCILA